ncbi:MAG: hypothetical protein LC650_03895 [Actinobacteria bacterium]|nr:hypothetical protein [Actinomycetota bacterium]
MEDFSAREAIRNITTRRNDIAQKLREGREKLRGSGISIRDRNHIVRYSARTPWRPLPVTVPALWRQLRYGVDFVSRPMPDYTQDDGYSMCGMEDGFADAQEGAARDAHNILDMLFVQTRERE